MADAALQWAPGALGIEHAWRTLDGHSAGFEFELSATQPGHLVCAIRGRHGDILARIIFTHARYTVAAAKALIEAIRPTLQQPAGDPWPTAEELRAAAERRHQHVARCRFVHAFPLGAALADACYCQKITKGLYEERLRREAAPTRA